MKTSIAFNLPESVEITYKENTYSFRWQHALATVLLIASTALVMTASPIDTSSKDSGISKQLEVSAKSLDSMLNK